MFVRADHSATPCTFCSAFDGPFLTTGVEGVGGRNIVICAEIVGPDGVLVRAGCAANIGRADGGAGRADYLELKRARDAQEQRANELERALESREQTLNVISVEALREVLAEAGADLAAAT